EQRERAAGEQLVSVGIDRQRYGHDSLLVAAAILAGRGGAREPGGRESWARPGNMRRTGWCGTTCGPAGVSLTGADVARLAGHGLASTGQPGNRILAA